ATVHADSANWPPCEFAVVCAHPNCPVEVLRAIGQGESNALEGNPGENRAGESGLLRRAGRHGAGSCLRPFRLGVRAMGDKSAGALTRPNARSELNMEIREAGRRELQNRVRSQAFMAEIIERGATEIRPAAVLERLPALDAGVVDEVPGPELEADPVIFIGPDD